MEYHRPFFFFSFPFIIERLAVENGRKRMRSVSVSQVRTLERSTSSGEPGRVVRGVPVSCLEHELGCREALSR
jgi:hypothetical protein